MARTLSTRTMVLLLLVALLWTVAPALSAGAQEEELPEGGTFVDDNRSEHEGFIEAIAAVGITLGCNPPDNDQYCPDQPVTRAEMATFLVRALGLPSGSATFSDTSGSVHAENISALASAGVTLGCNPPENDLFCPRNAISRGEMASMLARAYGLTGGDEARFGDAIGSVHVSAIAAIAEAGITQGCNPPDNTDFCPDSPVTRAQMASFLSRAEGLAPMDPPEAPFHLMASFTTHHNCCEARVSEVQFAARAIDDIYILPGDEFSMLEVLDNRVASGNCQTSTTLFNAIAYAGLEDLEHEPHSVHYARYPFGVESTLVPWGTDLRFRNNTDHPMEIRSSYTGTSVTVEVWGDNDDRSVIGDYTPAAGTILDVVDEGGDDARVVTIDVVRDGRRATATRTITDAGGTESETWVWTYRY